MSYYCMNLTILFIEKMYNSILNEATIFHIVRNNTIFLLSFLSVFLDTRRTNIVSYIANPYYTVE